MMICDMIQYTPWARVARGSNCPDPTRPDHENHDPTRPVSLSTTVRPTRPDPTRPDRSLSIKGKSHKMVMSSICNTIVVKHRRFRCTAIVYFIINPARLPIGEVLQLQRFPHSVATACQ